MGLVESITLGPDELARFFLAIVLLLAFSQTLGYLFHKSKLPKVVGEIIGGLLLGPTVLGYFQPDITNNVFNGFREEGKLISLVSWLGLILLMFISGFEIERSFSREDRRVAATVLLGATLVPFSVGLTLPSLVNFTSLIGPNGNTASFAIILAIAVAVTSIPVIAFDHGLITEPFFINLVLAAILTSLVAGAWFKLVLSRGWVLLKN